jgi:hypothetical protein
MRYGLLVPLVLLSGCVYHDNWYAPPAQRHPISGPESSYLKHFIAMNDPHATDHFIRDVGDLEANYFRWTGQKPTFRFLVRSRKGLKFAMDFSLPGDTMKQTGPVTVTYVVNGHELARETYAEPGEKHFEKPVPADWIGGNGDVVVSAGLDKVYIAEADKVKLGFTLVRAGFKD